MIRAATLAALLALAPLPAGAATMGVIPVDPDRQVTGTFAAPGTQAWQVYLRRGRFYAVRGETGGFESVVVRTPAGAASARFAMAYGDDLGDGASFRAQATGWHTVAVTMPASCFGGAPCLAQPGVNGGYLLSVGRDCPGDRPTPCTIAVGQTLRHLWASYDGDADLFRTSLLGGRGYAVAVPTSPGQGDYLASVLDARGRRVAWAHVEGQTPPLTFTAPTTGTYYVSVSPSDGAIGPYDLSLSAR